jgi:hypothetical protein
VVDGAARRCFFEGGGAPVSFSDGGRVLQLKEGTGELRRGPKGMGDGSAVELTEGGRRMVRRHEDGMVATVRSAGADTRLRTEMRGATQCS